MGFLLLEWVESKYRIESVFVTHLLVMSESTRVKICSNKNLTSVEHIGNPDCKVVNWSWNYQMIVFARLGKWDPSITIRPAKRYSNDRSGGNFYKSIDYPYSPKGPALMGQPWISICPPARPRLRNFGMRKQPIRLPVQTRLRGALPVLGRGVVEVAWSSSLNSAFPNRWHCVGQQKFLSLAYLSDGKRRGK